jgi:glycogen debranching enzyme
VARPSRSTPSGTTRSACWRLDARGGPRRRRRRLGLLAERTYRSFNERFWYAEGGYLYDVVDAETGGNDTACRPNQVLAISLDHPVLDRARGRR